MQSNIVLTLFCLIRTISALPQKSTPIPSPTPHCYSNSTTSSTSAPVASHDSSSTMFGVLSTLLAFCSVVIGAVGVWQYRQHRQPCSESSESTIMQGIVTASGSDEPRCSGETAITLVAPPSRTTTITTTTESQGPVRPALQRLRSSAMAKNFRTLHRLSTL